MGLRELISAAVKPKLNQCFSTLLDTHLGDEDDLIDDSGFLGSISDIQAISGRCLIIEYVNLKNERTQRVITCRQYAVRGDKTYVQAFCHHRKTLRSFRIDRIIDVFDPVTGESLSPVQAFFAQFSPDRIAKSGLTWGLSVGRYADLIALINGLIFIARCDREYHPSEMVSLEQAITGFWIRMEIQGDADFYDILRYSEKLAPDGETFWLAMARFREEPALASIFRRYAHLLIQADGFVRPEEAYWAIEIDDFLNDV